MWEYNYTPDPNELYHFGILGMKWGVRRWQNEDGSLTPAGYVHYYGHARPAGETGPVYAPGHKSSSSEKSSTSTKRSKAVSENKTKSTSSNSSTSEEHNGLTENQKKAIKIGLAVVGTGLAVYGGYKLSRLYVGAGMKIDPATGFRLLNNEMTDLDNLDAINPGRIRFLTRKFKNVELIDGSSANCMLCTTSYELRKRGFDVHAGYSTTGFMPDDLFPKIFKNYKGTTDINTFNLMSFIDGDTERQKQYKIILSELSKNPSGSRGNIMVWWQEGGGHSMIWEKVQDGSIKFMDGQTGQVYNNFFDDIFQHTDYTKTTHLLRTDNLEIDTDGIKDFINSDTILKTYVTKGASVAKHMANDPVVKISSATAIIVGSKKAQKYFEEKGGNK